MILSINANFLPQQIVNVQLNASFSAENENKTKHTKNSESLSPSNKNDKSTKNITSVESEPIYNAEYLNNPAPLYPPIAKTRGIEGKVLLEVLVNENGGASKVKIINSSGSNLLDESAFEAVKNWKFVPAKKFGKNIEAKILIPIEFKII